MRHFRKYSLMNETISFYVSGIYEDLSLRPTCVQFLPGNENLILVGNQGGEIHLFDVRKPKDCVAKNSKLEKLVTRIKFSPHDNTQFGVCTESTPFRILEIDEKMSSIDIK